MDELLGRARRHGGRREGHGRGDQRTCGPTWVGLGNVDFGKNLGSHSWWSFCFEVLKLRQHVVHAFADHERLTLPLVLLRRLLRETLGRRNAKFER